MALNQWIEVPVTEWVDDSEERFPTCKGQLTNLEWLQREKDRLCHAAPNSQPFIRIHPNYFDKDSHGRRRCKQIALYRFISPDELSRGRNGGARKADRPPRRAFAEHEIPSCALAGAVS